MAILQIGQGDIATGVMLAEVQVWPSEVVAVLVGIVILLLKATPHSCRLCVAGIGQTAAMEAYKADGCGGVTLAVFLWLG